MSVIINSVFVRLIGLLLATSVAFAQDRPEFRQQELDQMLAPIALYPDSLLSQILMGSTYPLEVVQAARWSRSNPHLKGQDAANAVEQMDWDASVKSLTAFPQILYMMDEKIDWTQRLGEAFLAFEPQVMDTVQGLRQRAAEAGNLRSGDQMRVTRAGDDYIIEPANPEVVYVPYYDPAVVYGPWWWPGYPPIYWAPPHGYYFAPAFGPSFFWGSGIVISTGFFFGHFNWHHRQVTVVHKQVHVAHRTAIHDHRTIITSKPGSDAWRHDPGHRRGVPFRNTALRQQFGDPRTPDPGARRNFHRQDAAPAVRESKAERSTDFREGRADARRDAATQNGRESSAFDRPAAQGNDRRSESLGNATRAQSRSMPAHPAPMAPAAGPGGRPVVANTNRNGQQGVVSERASHPEARRFSDRGHGGRRIATMNDSAPAARQSAAEGNPAPRMGNGSYRGNGGARAHGGRVIR